MGANSSHIHEHKASKWQTQPSPFSFIPEAVLKKIQNEKHNQKN